jgi:thiamine biosynthesis lipoprotein
MATTTRDDWKVWSCDASVVVTNPADVAEAGTIVRDILAEVDEASSRFRADSELTRRAADFVHGAEASPMLAYLVGAALDAAHMTDGDVDPTLGIELARLGYDRDISALNTGPELAAASIATSVVSRRSTWREIALRGTLLTIPASIQLDLGASAKAAAADLAASRVASQLGCGTLVAIGGDIATSGPQPDEGWNVLVQDTDDDPSQQVLLAAGAAMATSSTQKRRWMSGGFLRHHILDPQSGMPATPTWRSVTVAAPTCLEANALSTASIVRGFRAMEWLNGQKIGARFVDLQGRVVTTDDWPAPIATHELTGGSR